MAFIEQTGSNNPLNNVNVGALSTPIIADINGDDVPDLIVGASNGEIYFYEQVDSIFSPRTGINNPFNGIDVGSNSTPAIGDVNGDGLLDLVVGDNDGKQNFYKNIGSNTAPEYEVQTGTNNPFDGTDPGILSAPSLVDIDGDGDLDLVLGEYLSGTLNFYKNVGTSSTSPLYSEQTGTNNPFNSINVGATNTAPPSFVDLDGDGDFDLVVGQKDGTLRYFQNIGDSSTPSFNELTGTNNPFDGIDVGMYSSPTFADLDDDGDLDLSLGSSDGKGYYYLNENIPAVLSSATENLTETDAPLSASGTLTITDVDSPETFVAQTNTIGNHGYFSIDEAGAWSYSANSAHNELATGATYTDSFTVASADGTTTSVTVNITGTNDAAVIRSNDEISFLQFVPPGVRIDVGTLSVPAIADIDGDGDLDALIGSYDGTLRYFENTGNANVPSYSEQTGTNNPFDGEDVGSNSKPTFADIDGDGDLDAFVGADDGTIAYYQNEGTSTSPTFTAQTGTNNPFNGVDSGVDSAPSFADIDGDGDLDAFIGAKDSALDYYKNEGSVTSPSFTLQSGTNNPFNGLDVGSYHTPTFADIDGDGDIDALIGNENGTVKYFKNTGTTTSPTYSEQTGTNNPFDGIDVGSNSAPTFADVDGDGDLDAIIGQNNGTLSYYLNQTPNNATANLSETDAALSTSGKLNITDVDSAASFIAQTDTTGNHGSFSIDSLGGWNYDTDGDAHDEFIDGATYIDSFNVSSTDGTTTTVTIIITGSDDAPSSISGPTTGSVDENLMLPDGASGDLDYTDVDNTDDSWATTGTSANGYGSVSVTTNGIWTYTIDDNNTDVNALNASETLTDTFTATTANGATQTVTITINGANDAADISGEISGTVDDGLTPTDTTTGNLDYTDVDNTDDGWQVVSSGASTNGYGSFDISANGNWTYTIDDANTTVDALNKTETLTDTFTATTTDGTTQTVTITINGANEDISVDLNAGDLAITDINGGDSNDTLIVTESSGNLKISAPSQHLLAETGATQIDNQTVEVGLTSVTGSISFNLLAGTDSFNGVTLTEAVTVNGGDGADIIRGGSGNDSISGNNDTDRLYGNAGNDTILGGTENDFIQGGIGADSLDGGDGIDGLDYAGSSAGVTVSLLDGSASGGDAQGDTISGFERLYGSDHADQLTGDANANLLLGQDGNDTLIGGEGNDFIRGGIGADSLDGGDGIDALDYNGSSIGVTVSLLDGSASGGDAQGDTVSGFERVFGSDHADNITGDANANLLLGREGDDTLAGGEGNDFIRGGVGADSLDGGDGNDALDYTGSSAAVTVSLLDGSASGGDAQGDTIAGFERVFGSDHADNITGDVNANFLLGREGDDTLAGGEGNDFIRGGIGADSLDGGDGIDALDYSDSAAAVTVSLLDGSTSGGDAQGDTISGFERLYGSDFADQLTGDANANFILGREGADTLSGGDGNDFLRGGLGADSLDGGDGVDALDYTGSSSAVTVSLLDGSTSGGDAQGDTISGFERLYGSNFADQLTGDANANLLLGREGNDTLSGGEGNDFIRGGIGADSLDGGDGTDVLDYAGSNAAVTVSLLDNSASGGDAQGDTFTGFERLYGSNFADQLTGDANANLLIGRDGEDVIYGGEGNDILRGGIGPDSLDGGEGIDVLDYAGSSAGVIVSLSNSFALGGDAEGDSFVGFERLYGSNHADQLTGDANDNRLLGRDGDDFLDGMNGADTLTGSDGSDTFFVGVTESLLTGRDHITDFTIGTDILLTDFGVSAGNIDQLGAIASLDESSLQAELTTSIFEANTAATFTVGSRTYVAINDSVAGFSATSDDVVEITGFSGSLSELSIFSNT